MSKYIVTNKTFVKTNNKSSLIMNRYYYSLLVFILLSIVVYLIFGETEIVLSLLKSLVLSLGFGSICSYVINIIYKDYKFIDIYRKDNIYVISLIIGLFGMNTSIFVLFGAILISVVIKKINKNINQSASLYGILVIFLYRYVTNDMYYVKDLINIELNKAMIKDYLIGINYLNPILSLAVFVYLFIKKSIKYNIFISYISTIFIIMLAIGILNDIHIILPFVVLASNGIIFLSVYTLTDYLNTPTINETQILYGISLGIISSILTFVIYPFSVIGSLIIGPLLLTKYLDRNCYKIKYRKKSHS